GLRVALCRGDHVLGDGMEAGAGTATRSHLERTGAAHKISSPRPTACTGCGKTSGSGVAAASLEESLLATRDPTSAPVSFRRRARPAGPPRLRTRSTLSRAMVADRVAPRRSRTHQVLALNFPGGDPAQRVGP